MQDVSELVTTTEAARALRCAPETLRRWLGGDRPPIAVYRVGRRLRFNLGELLAWRSGGKSNVPTSASVPA